MKGTDKKKYLILDCDGVIFNSLPLIEEQIKALIDAISSGEYSGVYHACMVKILKRSLDSYIDKIKAKLEKKRAKLQDKQEEYDNAINDRESDKDIDDILRKIQKLKRKIDELDIKLEKRYLRHYPAKDFVLEEICPSFQNLIDYFAIYVKKNAYPGVINYIRKFYSEKTFDGGIYILTQYNTENERLAKEAFFKEFLPMVELIFVPFHPIPLFDPETNMMNEKRNRSNKMLYFIDYMRQKGLTTEEIMEVLHDSFFVDDSESNIKDANGRTMVSDERGGEHVVICGHTHLKKPEELTIDILRRFELQALKMSDERKPKL